MKTKQITISNGYDNFTKKPNVGDVVYLVSTNVFGSVPETVEDDSTRWHWSYECPKTSPGGQEQPDGWLGDYLGHRHTTARHSHGKWIVTSVEEKSIPKNYVDLVDERFTVKLKSL